jgi:hypothetical protein
MECIITYDVHASTNLFWDSTSLSVWVISRYLTGTNYRLFSYIIGPKKKILFNSCFTLNKDENHDTNRCMFMLAYIYQNKGQDANSK